MPASHIAKLAKALLIIAIFFTTSLSLLYTYNSFDANRSTIPSDMAIFAEHGHEFWQTGQLYQRSDNLAFLYRPSAPVFKFPPAYQLYIMPWVKHGIPEKFYLNTSYLYVALYFSGVLLLCKIIISSLEASLAAKPDSVFLIVFYGISSSIACMFQPFHEGLWKQVAEVPFFLICILAFLAIPNKPKLAGIAIAMAATAKIYPVFILLYFFLRKNMASIIGFLMGATGITALTLAVFGITEPLYYSSTLLPVLLKEETVCTYETLNIVCFLTPVITHALANTEFLLIRIATIAYLVILHRRTATDTALTNLLLYGATLSAMLILMPNHWIQYQILLLIPCLTAFAVSLHRHLPLTLAITILIALIMMCGPEMRDSALGFYYSGTMAELYAKAEHIGPVRTMYEASKIVLLIDFLMHYKPLAPYALIGITTRLLVNLEKPSID